MTKIISCIPTSKTTHTHTHYKQQSHCAKKLPHDDDYKTKQL